jgi:hypothetical protein
MSAATKTGRHRLQGFPQTFCPWPGTVCLFVTQFLFITH